MDRELAAKALELGYIFALNSDVHTVAERGFVQFAVRTPDSRLPTARVITAWPADRPEQLLHTVCCRNFTGGQEP